MTERQETLYRILSGASETSTVSLTQPISTEWIVVTGTPGSGKSTICAELGKSGHRIVPEASRTAINEALAQGFTAKEIFANQQLLSEAIMNRKLEIARRLPPSEPWIWDTGLVDALVFCRRANLDLTSTSPALLAYRYRSVIFLETLTQAEAQGDPLRPQTKLERARLHQMLHAEYVNQGYSIANIPRGTLQQRLHDVGRAIKDLGESNRPT